MTEDKNYPNPGDLIEVRRPGYQHWALYLGKGFVIHVTDVGSTSVSSSSSGSVFTRMAKVKKELLKEVTKNHSWAVNNQYDHYRTPFPMEEIIRRAEPCIDKELPYRLFFKNCEHFVTMLRYGEGVSWQV
ncbi:HRSL1 enzyme, partial [Prunella fulvescens]|nr:HRSL1 enzyme [Prunella fulvescens]